jgi:hypothetical protein
MPTRGLRAAPNQDQMAAWMVGAAVGAAARSGGSNLERPEREAVGRSALQEGGVLQCPVGGGGLADLRVVVYHSYRYLRWFA